MQDHILCSRWHQEAAVGRVCPCILGGGECDVHCIVGVLLIVGTHIKIHNYEEKLKILDLLVGKDKVLIPAPPANFEKP